MTGYALIVDRELDFGELAVFFAHEFGASLCDVYVGPSPIPPEAGYPQVACEYTEIGGEFSCNLFIGIEDHLTKLTDEQLAHDLANRFMAHVLTDTGLKIDTEYWLIAPHQKQATLINVEDEPIDDGNFIILNPPAWWLERTRR